MTFLLQQERDGAFLLCSSIGNYCVGSDVRRLTFVVE